LTFRRCRRRRNRKTFKVEDFHQGSAFAAFQLDYIVGRACFPCSQGRSSLQLDQEDNIGPASKEDEDRQSDCIGKGQRQFGSRENCSDEGKNELRIKQDKAEKDHR
jgi:hypothetical protein